MLFNDNGVVFLSRQIQMDGATIKTDSQILVLVSERNLKVPLQKYVCKKQEEDRSYMKKGRTVSGDDGAWVRPRHVLVSETLWRSVSPRWSIASELSASGWKWPAARPARPATVRAKNTTTTIRVTGTVGSYARCNCLSWCSGVCNSGDVSACPARRLGPVCPARDRPER